MKRARTRLILLLFGLMTLVYGCACVPSDAATTVFVYKDLNANGRYDPGEPPLPGVHVEWYGVQFPTNSSGIAVLKTSFNSDTDCTASPAVHPMPPSGYVLSQAIVPPWDCNSINFWVYNDLNRNAVYGMAPAELAALIPTPSAAEAPAISVDILSESPGVYYLPNQKITFGFKFTNTGNQPIQGPLTITSVLSDPASIKCDVDPKTINSFAPGQSDACTSYYITVYTGNVQDNEAITVFGTYQGVVISGQALSPIAYTTPGPGTQPPATVTAGPTKTATVAPSPTQTATLTPAPTATASSTPSDTPAPTVAAPVAVNADQLACRYGPGAAYLYQYGLYKGNEVTLVGRYDTAFGTWLYVKYKDDPRPCWVSPNFLDNVGDISGLPVYYPDKAPLVLFNDPAFVPSRFFPPTDVSADRTGNLVQMSWTGLVLALGDRESATSPRFLVEAWTCIGGKLTFTPIGVGATYQGKDMSTDTFSAQVEDDAGCSEPSHAQVYLAHKDGYVGPVQVPWPQQ